MKRGKKPRDFNTHKVGKEMHDTGKQKIQNLGPSFADLPGPICFDILLRLPISRLLICRCVCKTWQKLISDPDFAKLHFSRAESFPLIRSLSPIHISRNLYLVEPPKHSLGFDLREDCYCYGENFPDHHFHLKLETKLKIPLRNAELAMNNEGEANVNCNPKGGVKRKRCIKLRPKDHKLNLVNSSNGFLCLSEPSLNDPVVVCNPITGEFINLPVPTQADECTKSFSDCGLGFSPKTNQYKVIRMFDQQQQIREWICEPITGRERFSSRVAEIHTLGTGSWRRIGCAPSSIFTYRLRFPTYLNGSLHWLLIDHEVSNYIISFNFDTERFQSVPPPPLKKRTINLATMKNMSLGVLRGSLCICYCSCFEDIDIWVMEKYGVQESWRELFCISTLTDEGRWLHGLYEPLTYLSSGAILFFHRLCNALVYFNPENQSLKFLKVRGIKSKYEAIAHTPSFISLKDAVAGDNMEVLNITSRCAGFKLLGETKGLFLKREDEDLDSDLNLSSNTGDSDYDY